MTNSGEDISLVVMNINCETSKPFAQLLALLLSYNPNNENNIQKKKENKKDDVELDKTYDEDKSLYSNLGVDFYNTIQSASLNILYYTLPVP